MRLSMLAACGFAWILLAAASAPAHISVTPGLLVASDTQALRLLVHNDLDRPMTGLAVTAPTGLRIVGADADDSEQWQDVVEGGSVTWSGGPLAPNTGAAFVLDVAVDETMPPGPVQLQAQQLYPGGGKLPWPVFLTVVPEEDETQLVTWAIVAGIFVLVTAGIVAIAVLRRGRTLQEK